MTNIFRVHGRLLPVSCLGNSRYNKLVFSIWFEWNLTFCSTFCACSCVHLSWWSVSSKSSATTSISAISAGSTSTKSSATTVSTKSASSTVTSFWFMVLETVVTINWFVLSWLKWNLTLFSTISTSCIVHLSWWSIVTHNLSEIGLFYP